jgi:hypothetical protein
LWTSLTQTTKKRSGIATFRITIEKWKFNIKVYWAKKPSTSLLVPKPKRSLTKK